MQLSRPLLAAFLIGTAPLITSQSTSAAPLLADHALGKIQSSAERVQYRHHGGRYHGGWRHNHRYRYGNHGGGYYRNDGAVLGGLAAGAIIGGAIANSQARTDSSGYCSQRYRSYDPASGTYLGYDGQRHSCP